MALRLGMLKCAAEGNNGCRSGIRRWAHVPSMVRPLDGALESYIASPHLTLPELDANQDTSNNSSNSGLGLPGFSFGGSMELMAVPKRKVTPHKRGIRNGPKALKPIPVIIRCKSCGQVKLPHFYCCSGDRGKNVEQNK
ncbi:ribosomal protein [Salix suchowensis]|nr:ribosomal protein [Salix suchowensis]